ncbi:MAG: hypothetical protein NTV23_04450 [Propionibacteriales bacterium]|nr:hypothetical protein [Propionibacteriales bacterium]
MSEIDPKKLVEHARLVNEGFARTNKSLGDLLELIKTLGSTVEALGARVEKLEQESRASTGDSGL